MIQSLSKNNTMKIFRSYLIGLAAFAAAGLALPSCQDDFDAPQIDVPQASITANTTIAELKSLFWDEATNYAKEIRDEADPERRFIIAGRVISSDEEGNVFKSLVIQDETAALAFSIDTYNLYLNYRRGQEIVMDVTGMTIGKYAGLQQMGRKSWYENGKTDQVSFMSIEAFAAKAELNGVPVVADLDTLIVNSFAQIPNTPEGLQKYQSQLVRFKNVYFEDGGKKKFSAYHATTNEEQNRNIIDRNGNPMVVRTSGYCTFWNKVLPTGNLDIVGLLSYYNNNWQIILIDGNGCIKVGDRPGTKEKPYTVTDVVSLESQDLTDEGWVKGYIVGAVAPEVEVVSGDNDIQWEAPTVLNNTLVIAPSADCRNIDQCVVVALPAESALRQLGNLRDNPGNLGKEILINARFERYMGAYGLTGNTGKADEFEIDGVEVSTGEFADGDGNAESPYNVKQIVAMNPQSTTAAVATGVWVKGYIVGSMPTGGSSTTLAGTSFGLADAATTNLVLGPTADCTDASKCIGVQLPTSMRDALALANVPGNLGKVLAIKGDVMKYCAGPGIKQPTEYKLEGGSGGDTPNPPAGETVTSLDATFDGGSMPAGWTNVNISGDKAWYVASFDNNYYAAMTGFKGTQPPFDQWLLSPAIDMSKVDNKVLTFDSQVNGYGSTTSVFEVYVLSSADVAAATKTKLNPTLATAPASGYSGFVPSGDVSLAGYSGTVYIGFRYYATQDANYATWCVDNIRLNVTGGTTPDPNPNPDPSGDAVEVLATDITNVPGSTTVSGYTFDIQKNNGKTAPAIHSGTSAIRLYADNSISVNGGRMAKIVFTLARDAGYRYTDFTPSTGTLSPAQAAGDTSVTWVGDASDVTFTVGATATMGSEEGKPGQIRFTKIEIFPAE